MFYKQRKQTLNKYISTQKRKRERKKYKGGSFGGEGGGRSQARYTKVGHQTGQGQGQQVPKGCIKAD